jgi:hypothetical protein
MLRTADLEESVDMRPLVKKPVVYFTNILLAHLRQYSWAKKNVSTKKLRSKLLYEKKHALPPLSTSFFVTLEKTETFGVFGMVKLGKDQRP